MQHRHRLWCHGFAVAEAMDTAQRGGALDWSLVQELIRRSSAEAKATDDAVIASGVSTDQLEPGVRHGIDDIVRAYEEQLEFVEDCGSRAIVMASRALAASARGPGDYGMVYDRILSQACEPVILHWLGDAFDPHLRGYWGSTSATEAMEICLAIIHDNASRIDGIKISLLDARLEIEMRRRLPAGVRMYTGDDFDFDSLILGDDQGHSDALLGIFDATFPAVSCALAALRDGGRDEYRAIMTPLRRLSREIFRADTQYYKVGLVLLAYVNGYQDHFTLLGGMESARSIVHLSNVFRLADEAGLVIDPEEAASRFRHVLATHGVT